LVSETPTVERLVEVSRFAMCGGWGRVGAWVVSRLVLGDPCFREQDGPHVVGERKGGAAKGVDSKEYYIIRCIPPEGRDIVEVRRRKKKKKRGGGTRREGHSKPAYPNASSRSISFFSLASVRGKGGQMGENATKNRDKKIV